MEQKHLHSRHLWNFYAGPAILAKSVIEQAAQAVQELRGNGHSQSSAGVGFSLLEISHRGQDYEEINRSAEQLVHEVIGVPSTHQVLFLQGGASLQFTMVPLNLSHPSKPACYIDTGAWSQRAITESQVLGETKVIASSQATNYDRIPEFPAAEAYKDSSYVHITTNNTIYGTEYMEIPQLANENVLVCDLSSNIASRPMNLEHIALGYAGAQKNLGPSGVTLVFIRKDLLTYTSALPVTKFLQYKTHAENTSLYNTPNTFGVLVLKLVLEWIRDEGGLSAIAQRNRQKAETLYQVLDQSQLFTPHAQPGSRSFMNVAWTLGGAASSQREALTKKFLSEAETEGFIGLPGHRSVGGCRASIYNAFPQAGVDALCQFMIEFERKA